MLFSEIRQGTAMIEMKVSNDDQINSIINVSRRSIKLLKFRVSPVISEEHMDANIKHDCFVVKGDANTRAAYLLSCP